MADIPAGHLSATAWSLMRAGQWAPALDLLAAAAPADEAERATLAVMAAEVAVNRDFWCGTADSDSFVAAAVDAAASGSAGGGGSATVVTWDLELLRLRGDYYAELAGPDGPRFGPEGRDASFVGELGERAAVLRGTAPDGARNASATFLAGIIADNLRGDAGLARSLFTSALARAEDAGDDETVSEALRHLGYHDAEAGEAGLARECWTRSARLRQRAGAVPYALSQVLLLAGLPLDHDGALDHDGDSAGDGGRTGARAVATAVRSWADALGARILEAQAADLADTGA
ncbi:MAG: hypothetical protein ACRDN0_11225 [Trebonia sp.]